ncbi:MAG TPA: hypothetical protein VJ809_09535 [Pirellulales bacterium]|nr:hypothetical protein [Pirellulales bacterium]
MGRMFSAFAGLVAYFCVGTILAQLIIAGYAASQGYLDKQKVSDMLALARGAKLASAADKTADAKAKPAQMMSIEELDQRRTTMTRHLELREQSVQNALAQIATEREKLLKERQTFDMLVADFRKLKEATESQQLAKGQEDTRAILENLKPKQAKDLILRMIAADEKEEVVAMLSAMPISKQVKIIGEFKLEDEQRKIDDILRLLRQGNGDTTPAGLPDEAPAATDLNQP